jgi:hypothetical protein
LGDLGVDGRMIFGGGGSYKEIGCDNEDWIHRAPNRDRLCISWPAERLPASEEGLCFLELAHRKHLFFFNNLRYVIAAF